MQTHEHAQKDRCMQTQARKHTRTRTHADTHRHRHRYTHRHTNTHTNKHKQTNTQRHTYTHTHTYTRARAHRDENEINNPVDPVERIKGLGEECDVIWRHDRSVEQRDTNLRNPHHPRAASHASARARAQKSPNASCTVLLGSIRSSPVRADTVSATAARGRVSC
jgi:hypothetical protein